MIWRTEQEFVHSFSSKLTRDGIDTIRIETGSTGNGVPDMFIQGRGRDMWLEFKNEQRDCPPNTARIKWRPGQVGWHTKYAGQHMKLIRANGMSYVRVQHSFTLAAFNGDILVIRMPGTDEFDHGYVDVNNSTNVFVLPHIMYAGMRGIDLFNFLLQRQYRFLFHEDVTLEYRLRWLIQAWAMEFTGHYLDEDDFVMLYSALEHWLPGDIDKLGKPQMDRLTDVLSNEVSSSVFEAWHTKVI